MTRNATLLLRSVAVLSLACSVQAAMAETITVSAAASLSDAFNEMARLFEAANPGDTVHLNVGGSGALWQQIDKGAPVDVFASADEQTMDAAQRGGMVVPGTRAAFAANTVVLIQPLSARKPLASLNALADASVRRIALGNPDSVPAGRYAKAALEAAGLWATVSDKIIPTQNVRQSLDYVARGEVDAGFVYGTDAALMKEKVRLAGTVPVGGPVSYPIAVMRHGAGKRAALRFVDFVRSQPGQETLRRFGFEAAGAR